MCRCLAKMCGFGSLGPESGGFAASYRSCCYGGDTPSGGWFACCQRRGMSEEGGSCCCCSVLLFVLGVLFISTGVMFCYYPGLVFSIEPSVYYNFSFLSFVFIQNLDKVMLSAGVFLCLTSLLPCCSSCCMAFFHIITFIIILVCIVIMGIAVHSFDRENINVEIKENMENKLKSFDNKTEESFWNFIRQDLKCCGIFNSSDWQENTLHSNGTMPDSCCLNIYKSCGKTAGPGDLFSAGCFPLLEEQVFSYYLVMVMVLSFFSVTGGLVFCSCCCQMASAH